MNEQVKGTIVEHFMQLSIKFLRKALECIKRKSSFVQQYICSGKFGKELNLKSNKRIEIVVNSKAMKYDS